MYPTPGNEYVSPGQNGLNWAANQLNQNGIPNVDPTLSPGQNFIEWLIHSSFKPGTASSLDHIDSFFHIAWGVMFTHILELATLGILASVVVKAFGNKESSTMIMLVTVVQCFAVIMHAVTK